VTRRVEAAVIEKTGKYLNPAPIMMELSARITEAGVLSLADSDHLEAYAIEVMKGYPQLTMFNIGDEQGNFLMPKRLPDGTFATKIIDRTVTPPTVTWKYRDEKGEITGIETSTDVQYDPRVRQWYVGAKEAGKACWTPLYIFFTDGMPGITAACPVYGSDGKLIGVFGADIELSDLSEFLRGLKIGKTGVAVIINEKNEIVACPDVSRVVTRDGNGELRHALIDELGVGWVTAAFKEYARRGATSFAFTHEGDRYNASFKRFPDYFGRDWTLGIVVPESDFIGSIIEAHKNILVITGLILLLAVFIAVLISRSISGPIVRLAEETEKIKSLHLDEEIDIRSPVKEIQLMSNALSSMKTGLKAFERYVPAALVRQLIRTGEEARIGGRKKELTIFFSDIAGFTTISEGLSPEELMVRLSEYLDKLTKIVMEQNGTVDKYIGDAIMAFWGAPLEDDDHALHACRAALLCQRKVRELTESWEREGKGAFPTRIGIHTGETIVGNMGSRERMNYSAIGDSVNVASRLEGINKVYGTGVVVSHATYEKVAGAFVFRPLDMVTVRGKKQEIMIYELIGEKGEDLDPRILELCEVFTLGVDAYLRGDREEAVRIFTDIRERFPADKATAIYLDRLGVS